MLRLIFRGGSFTKLPDRQVAADYLSPRQRARLAGLEARYNVEYDRGSFLMSAFDLLARRLDFDDATIEDATDVVPKATRRRGERRHFEMSSGVRPPLVIALAPTRRTRPSCPKPHPEPISDCRPTPPVLM